ncbi:MAG: NTP transferase domain-containing protein, partial [Vicinamibacterales bacterium]
MNGIILAGGRATRLGPLAAQLNKSLISVGQQPMLAHQVQQLRRVGCERVVVVVSPDQLRQVEDVATRAGLEVIVVKQPKPNGPADALWCGLPFVPNEPITVLMADTYLDDVDVPLDDDVVVVAPAPVSRRWCWHTETGWTDDYALAGTPVAVGAYHFASTKRAREVCYELCDGQEVEMAAFLNRYGETTQLTATSWLDVGDLD